MTLVLIVRLAGQRVAIPAADVASVVELDPTTPVPCAPVHIAGLAALRSRVLTVVDGRRAIGMKAAAHDSREAVVIDLDSHHYAITVDAVDDVIEAAEQTPAARMPLGDGWARIAAGFVEAEGDMLLLVDVAALVAGPDAAAA